MENVRMQCGDSSGCSERSHSMVHRPALGCCFSPPFSTMYKTTTQRPRTHVPKKSGLYWFMPAFVKSSVGSSTGTQGLLGQKTCPCCSTKKSKKVLRTFSMGHTLLLCSGDDMLVMLLYCLYNGWSCRFGERTRGERVKVMYERCRSGKSSGPQRDHPFCLREVLAKIFSIQLSRLPLRIYCCVAFSSHIPAIFHHFSTDLHTPGRSTRLILEDLQ